MSRPCCFPPVLIREALPRMNDRASGPASRARDRHGIMSKTYVVSGRGMKVDAALWPVPAGVEIHFYFPSRREPQIYKTRTVLDKLMLEVGMFPDHVAVAGDMIPSHFVWAHGGGQPSSGVFRRQTGNLAMDLGDTDANRPVALSHIVKTLSADRARSTTAIHWIVRESEDPTDLTALDCQYPPRLRSGTSDDGDESREMPLSGQMPLRESRRMPLSPMGMGPTEAWPGVKR